MAREVREKYMRELADADVRELAIRRRLSRMDYSRRCAEASAVKAYQKRGLHLSPGMEIGYVVTDAAKWEVDTERDASEFDSGYYGKLLEKAWEEVAFVLATNN
jgi:DNA polymerase I